MKSKILGCILGIGLFTSMVVPSGVTAQEEQHRTNQAQRYTVTDLGKVGPPPGQAFFVTNNGLIAGAAATPAAPGVMRVKARSHGFGPNWPSAS